MKQILYTLILTVGAFSSGLAWNSYAAPSAPMGYVPFEYPTGTYQPADIFYNGGTGVKTVNFFGTLYSFRDDNAYFLGTGSGQEINAESGSLSFGDVQHNSNETEIIITDGEHSIKLKGDVYLPLLPNCARLATDANGKLSCGE